jgi:trypsin
MVTLDLVLRSLAIFENNVTCPNSTVPIRKSLNMRDQRIIGGEEAIKNELYYHLALEEYQGLSHEYFCGATLIHPRLALTAAHCVSTIDLNIVDVTLTAGCHNIDEPDVVEQPRYVDKIYVHPDYGDHTYRSDIAIVRVDQPFSFNNEVRPVPLATPDFPLKGEALVSGWGCTYAGCTKTPHILRKVKVEIVPPEECKKSYVRFLPDNMICAGYPDGGKDACQGDSGGPLVVDNGTDKVLVGVVSWGKNCACPGFPGVYAKVSNFLPWIDGIMSATSQFAEDPRCPAINPTCGGIRVQNEVVNIMTATAIFFLVLE